MGRRTLVTPTDVASSSQVQAAVALSLEAFGKIDVLVNNAGISVYREPFDYTDEEWDRVIGVNLTGVWLFCRYVGPHMVSRGEGSIINVASVGADQASYYRAPYMASKGGVASLTRALALDLAAKNVRVNAVAPSAVMTEGTEEFFGDKLDRAKEVIAQGQTLQRNLEVGDLAGTIVYLASDASKFVTGQTIMVDGGTVYL